MCLRGYHLEDKGFAKYQNNAIHRRHFQKIDYLNYSRFLCHSNSQRITMLFLSGYVVVDSFFIVGPIAEQILCFVHV